MPDVLLGQAYYLRFDPKLWRAQRPYPPLGTLYAASYLRNRGHSVALFDAMLAQSEIEWAQALDRHQPRIAVIYEDSFNYLSKMCLLRMRDAARRMIELARLRGIDIVVSGSDATDHPETYLQYGARAVVIGEGEITLDHLVRALLTGTQVSDVAGIAYLGADGSIRRTAARPFIRNLDDLPFPAWDLIDVDRYRAIWQGRHGYYAMNMATTRGCPFHCNWCAKPIYGQRYVTRTPQSVVNEFSWLKREYRPNQIAIADDVFGLQPGWIGAFARLVADADARIPFRCLMRADQIDADVSHALAAAGCQMVWMGAESGSQRILDAMEKGIRVEQIREAARLLKTHGISVGMFLQFGYPGEMWDDIEATLALVRDAAPDDIGVSVSYPLPGTKFYERVRTHLGPKQNWFDSSDLAVMYRATYEPGFYRLLHHVVHYEFRLRRLEPLLRRVIAHPLTIRPRDVKRVAAWVFNRAALPIAARKLRSMAA